MNIPLTPELEQLVDDKVKTGRYSSPAEVVEEGLRLLEERDREMESLRRDVRDGLDEIERGDYAEYSADEAHQLAERVKARGLKRLRDEGNPLASQ